MVIVLQTCKLESVGNTPYWKRGKMLVKEKEVKDLKVGNVIVFKRGGDVAQKIAKVSGLEVDGKYVTIWFTDNNNTTGFILSEKCETITVTTARTFDKV